VFNGPVRRKEEKEEEGTKLIGKGKWEELYACKYRTHKDAINWQILRKAFENQ